MFDLLHVTRRTSVIIVVSLSDSVIDVVYMSDFASEREDCN